MKNVLQLVLALVVSADVQYVEIMAPPTAALASAPAKRPHCGTERWPVKTLTDSEASQVDLSAPPAATTIDELRSLKAPKYNDKNPRASAELHLWEVTDASVTAFKLEADQDFHVVIVNAVGQTMIVEIPNPPCMANSPAKAAVAAVRSKFIRLFGKPTAKLKRLKKPVPITIVGVGFFDRIHGQTGVAPNGIEVHPVMQLTVEAP